MKQPTVEKLRLYAEILEKNLKWQFTYNNNPWSDVLTQMTNVDMANIFFRDFDIRIKPEPKKVPLELSDVEHGALFRYDKKEIHTPSCYNETGVIMDNRFFWYNSDCAKSLFENEHWEYRTKEGEWKPCHKTII